MQEDLGIMVSILNFIDIGIQILFFLFVLLLIRDALVYFRHPQTEFHPELLNLKIIFFPHILLLFTIWDQWRNIDDLIIDQYVSLVFYIGIFLFLLFVIFASYFWVIKRAIDRRIRLISKDEYLKSYANKFNKSSSRTSGLIVILLLSPLDQPDIYFYLISFTIVIILLTYFISYRRLKIQNFEDFVNISPENGGQLEKWYELFSLFPLDLIIIPLWGYVLLVQQIWIAAIAVFLLLIPFIIYGYSGISKYSEVSDA